MRYAYHHSCTQIFLSPHPRIQTSEQPQWMLISVLQTNYSIFFFVFNKFSLGQPKAISGKQDQRETGPCFLRPVLEGGIRLPITRYLKYLAPFHNSRSPPPRLSSDKEQKPRQLKLVFLYPWRDLSLRPSLLPPYPGPVFLPLAPFLRQNCLSISSRGAPPRLFSTSPNRRAHLQSL